MTTKSLKLKILSRELLNRRIKVHFLSFELKVIESLQTALRRNYFLRFSCRNFLSKLHQNWNFNFIWYESGSWSPFFPCSINNTPSPQFSCTSLGQRGLRHFQKKRSHIFRLFVMGIFIINRKLSANLCFFNPKFFNQKPKSLINYFEENN